MAPHLVPCPGCTRHVRVVERACPFCAGELPESFRATPRPVRPAARLGRAAVLAFGLGLGATAAAGCGGSSTETEEPAPDPGAGDGAGDGTAGGDTTVDPGGPPDDDDGAAVAEYGAPAYDD